MAANTSGSSGVIHNRFVQVILLSGLLLQVGIWVRNYAVLLFVVDQTNGDPIAVSLISVAQYAPIFLFSFIGGTFADRWRPKRTMIWCDTLSAVSIFVVLLTLWYGSWKGVFFATLVSAVLSQFSQPSGMRLFKLHVPEEQVQAGMSLYQTLSALFMILGPSLGSAVYGHYGIYVAIAIMGISFLLSAAVLVMLPKDPSPSTTQKTSLRVEMGEGFRYVFSRRLLATLGLCFTMAGLGLGLIQPLGVFLVTEQLGMDKDSLKWLMMINGAAMIIGGGLAIGISKKVSPQWLLVVGLAISALSIAIIGFSTSFWLTMTAEFINGLVMPALQIALSTIILKNTNADFVGRVNGILSPMFIGAMVVSMSFSGVLKETFSLFVMFEASALLFVVGVLVMIPLLVRQENVKAEIGLH